MLNSISPITCFNVCGGADPDQLTISIQGQIGGNDLSNLQGGVIVSADVPLPGGGVLSPTFIFDTSGTVHNGGISFRFPFPTFH